MNKVLSKRMKKMALAITTTTFLLIFLLKSHFWPSNVESKFEASLVDEDLFLDRRATAKMACRNLEKKKLFSEQFKRSEQCMNTMVADYDCYLNLVAFKKLETTFCFVQKIASRNVLRYLLKLGNNSLNDAKLTYLDIHTRKDLGRISDAMPLWRMKPRKLKHALFAYKRIVIARNPLDRLLSAWNDKLNPVDNDFMKYSKKIIAKYRNKSTVVSPMRNTGPTLEEFFMYLRDGGIYGNVHWRPASQLCLMCSIDYDYIGKFEHLQRDVEAIGQRLKRPTTQGNAIPTFNLPKLRPTFDRYQEFRLLPRRLVDEVLKLYSADYQIFGYNITRDLLDLPSTSSNA